MTDEAIPKGVTRTEMNPLQYGGEARSVQEFRLDFREDIKELRVGLTGTVYKNGQAQKLFDGLVCEKHFSELLNIIHFSNTRGWTLSRLHEEKIEMYVIGIMDSIHIYLIDQCYYCKNCGLHKHPSKIPIVLMMIESFCYGNMNRASGGFESGILAQMQQVQSTERYDRDEKKTGFLSGLTSAFGGRR